MQVFSLGGSTVEDWVRAGMFLDATPRKRKAEGVDAAEEDDASAGRGAAKIVNDVGVAKKHLGFASKKRCPDVGTFFIFIF